MIKFLNIMTWVLAISGLLSIIFASYLYTPLFLEFLNTVPAVIYLGYVAGLLFIFFAFISNEWCESRKVNRIIDEKDDPNIKCP